MLIVSTFQALFLQNTAHAAVTQSITLLGGKTDANHPYVNPATPDGVYPTSGYSPEADVSWDNGLTWKPAYLDGTHPWGYVTGTDAWILPCATYNDSTCHQTFIFRHRFYVASDFDSPTVTYQMNVDDYGQFFLNGLTPGVGLSNGNAISNRCQGGGGGSRGSCAGQDATNKDVTGLLLSGWNAVYVKLEWTIGGLGINYAVTVNYNSVTAPIYSTPVGAPEAPIIGTATAIDSHTATVTFSPPASDGGSQILTYIATASSGGETGTVSGPGGGSITISGLVTGLTDSFTVKAVNAFGTSVASAASNSVTPLINTVPPVIQNSSPVSAPDPTQSSKIISVTPSSGPLEGGTFVVKMAMDSCKVLNISFDGRNLPLNNWVAESSEVSIKVPSHTSGPVPIQIFNGCVPVLPAFTYQYVAESKEPTVPPLPEEPAKPAVKVVNPQPTKQMHKIGTIYFANGTSFINDAGKKTLDKVIAIIQQQGPEVILSYGHTDIKGGVDNTALSRNRAKVTADYLSQALAGTKVKSGWFAATQPISTGETKADLAKNRRAEIYIK